MEHPDRPSDPFPLRPNDSTGQTEGETVPSKDFPSVPPPDSSAETEPTPPTENPPQILQPLASSFPSAPMTAADFDHATLDPERRTPDERLENFARSNLAPFWVGCAALVLIASFGVLHEVDDQLREEYAKNAEKSGEAKTKERKAGKATRAEQTAASSAETALLGTMALCGFLFCGFLVIGGFFSENIRRIFDFRLRLLGPPPALNEMDFIAVVFLYFAFALWSSAAVLISTPFFSPDELTQNAFAGAAGMVAYALLIPAVIYLARRRAAAEGSPPATSAAGFWPFWRRVPPFQDDGARGLLKDVALGIFTWPLFFWVFAIAMYVNENALVYWAGGKEILDRNVIFDALQHTTDRPLLLLIFFTTVVCAPFFEELFFRGFLYNALRRRLGFGAAATLSAALFSVVHQVNANLLPLFVLGLLFAWLYERTGRLVAPMAFHAVFNGISLSLFMLQPN